MKRTIAVFVFIILIFSAIPVLATGKSIYKMELINKLCINSDLVVDGIITKIDSSGSLDKCRVELQRVYNLKLPYEKTPLNYNILLPEKSVTTGQNVLLFLRKGKMEGSLIKTIDDKTNKSIVYE